MRVRLPGMVAAGALLVLLLTAGPAHGFGFQGCVSNDGAGPCTSIANTNALDGPHAVALSPDGEQLYSAAAVGGAVARFGVDPLTGAPGFTDCFGTTADGPCTSIANANALIRAAGSRYPRPT